MRIADSRVAGFLPLQHSGYIGKSFNLQLRALVGGVRVTDRRTLAGDDVGHWVVDENSFGDIHGGQLWKKAGSARPIPMWRFATPVIVEKGNKKSSSSPPSPGAGFTFTGGGGVANLAGGQGGPNVGGDFGVPNLVGGQGSPKAGATFEGVRESFIQGGPNVGAVFEDHNTLAGKGPVAPGTQYGIPQPVGAGGPNNGQPGQGAPPVATQNNPNKSDAPDTPTVFAVMDDAFSGDPRLENLTLATPRSKYKSYPKIPKGASGISLVANWEDRQIDLWHHTDPRLVAANYAGDPDIGSAVMDLNKDNELDEDRYARLQSAFRVLKKPLGGKNALGFQLGPSGLGDTRGGFFVDRPETPAGATVTGESKAIGMGSRYDRGPFDCGPCKKHNAGKDADGNLVGPLHLRIETFFRQNDTKDGPLKISNWIQGVDQSYPVDVHFDFDGQNWNWYTTSDTTWCEHPPAPEPPYPPPPPWPPDPPPPDDPPGPAPVPTPGPPPSPTPNPPPDCPCPTPTDSPSEPPPPPDPCPPCDGSAPSGSGGTGGGDLEDWQPEDTYPNGGWAGTETMGSTALVNDLNAGYITTAQAVGMGEMLAKPYNYESTQTDQRYNQYPNLNDAEKRNTEAPVTGVMAAFGAQGGDSETASVPTLPPPPPSLPPAPASPPGSPPGPPPPDSPAPPPPPPTAPAVPTSPTHVPATGDPFNRTHERGRARFAGGTGHGGWVILPPERDPAMYENDFDPPSNIDVSETHFVVGPGAAFGAGLPDFASGKVKHGFTWNWESSTGDLVFKSRFAGSSEGVEAVRFSRSEQTIKWRNRTDYTGEIRHNNTANRQWDFPDESGSVVVMGSGPQLGGGATAVLGTVGGDGPTSEYQAIWGKFLINGTYYYMPLWR